MPDSFAVLYGELRGFLQAFEWINGKPNHNYTFSLELIAAGADPRKAIEDHFYTNHYAVVELVKRDNWEPLISQALSDWLLAYLNTDNVSETGNYTHPHFGLYSSSNQQTMLEELLLKMVCLVSPVGAGWEIEGYSSNYNYGVAFAIEGANYIIVLYFGVVD